MAKNNSGIFAPFGFLWFIILLMMVNNLHRSNTPYRTRSNYDSKPSPRRTYESVPAPQPKMLAISTKNHNFSAVRTLNDEGMLKIDNPLSVRAAYKVMVEANHHWFTFNRTTDQATGKVRMIINRRGVPVMIGEGWKEYPYRKKRA